MMLSARALLDREPDPSEEDVRWALSGNLCRCTGYQNIVKAVLWAARKEAGSMTALDETDDRRPGREPPPGRGRAVRARSRPLRRRHPPARHAAHGDPAQPAGARPHRLHRHVEGLGDPGRPAGAHRRDDGPAQPRLDADALLRHPGRARHRQGALPGPGGVRRRRRRPVHRQGRVRGDRRRVRGAARDRQPGAGGGAGRAGHPRRQGGADRQHLLPLGGRRRRRHRAGVRAGRRRLLAQAALPAQPPVADRVLRLDRRLRRGHRQAHRLHDHPGAAHHPRGRGARGRAARAHDPDRVARHRRRLRQQGADLPGLRRRRSWPRSCSASR